MAERSIERKLIDGMVRNGLTDRRFSPRTFGRLMSFQPYDVQDPFILAVGHYIDEMNIHVETGYNSWDNINSLAQVVKHCFPSSGQELLDLR